MINVLIRPARLSDASAIKMLSGIASAMISRKTFSAKSSAGRWQTTHSASGWRRSMERLSVISTRRGTTYSMRRT